MDNNISKIFSKNLIRLLNKQNKNQNELANYIGVSGQTITNYVKGYNLPRMDKVDKIASFFKVSRDDLLTEEIINNQTPQQRVIDLLGEDVVSANTGININDFTEEELDQIADRLLEYARFLANDKKLDR